MTGLDKMVRDVIIILRIYKLEEQKNTLYAKLKYFDKPVRSDMYNRKQADLIEFLYVQGNASSNTIASQLSISKRTVISYVKDINRSHPDADLIRSSNKGYSLDKDVFEQIKDELPGLTDNDVGERTDLIIRGFLTGFRDTINMYDIGERLHYSESTIRSSLYRIKSIVKDYGLDIQLSNNSASLIGSEEGKRELYFSLFQDTLEHNLYDFSKMDAYFPQYTSDRIFRAFDECIKQYYHDVCDYEKVSLFYRFLITMDRVSHGHIITNEPYMKFIRETDIKLGETITSRIGRITGVTFPAIEVEYVIEIFSATCIYGRISSRVTPESLDEDLWPECYRIVEESADDIKRIYGVDIRASDDDYVDFAMHVRALIRRLRSGVRIHNPYLGRLKRDCVAAYDCAVYVANKIIKQYPGRIREDDIADLALCFGNSFEQSFGDTTKIKVLFVLPSYYSVHDNLYTFYKNEFENRIQAQRTSDLSAFPDPDFAELIVSTQGLKNLGGKKYIRISPIQNANDRNRIDEMINKIRHDKLLDSISGLLNDMRDDEYFYRCPEGIYDRTSALEYMIRPLIESGVADEEFERDILERAELADSGTDIIAVMSAPEYYAKKDTLSFMILGRPINWGDRQVQGVILFTSAEGSYQTRCFKVMRRLLHVMGRRETPKKILQCRSIDDLNRLFI